MIRYGRDQVLVVVREALDIYEKRRATEGWAAIDSTMDAANALLDQLTFPPKPKGMTWARHIVSDGKSGCYQKVYFAEGSAPPRVCPHCKRALYHVDQEAI